MTLDEATRIADRRAKMTTNLWNQPGVPHKGWSCTGVDDLEEATATCQMCGKERIRYVHAMEHPDHPDTLEVGCICAGRMADDYEGAKRREKEMRNRAGRRSRWLSRQWRVSAKGNHYMKLEGCHLLVFKKGGGFGIKVGDDFDCRTFTTPTAAKLALFDAFDVA